MSLLSTLPGSVFGPHLIPAGVDPLLWTRCEALVATANTGQVSDPDAVAPAALAGLLMGLSLDAQVTAPTAHAAERLVSAVAQHPGIAYRGNLADLADPEDAQLLCAFDPLPLAHNDEDTYPGLRELLFLAEDAFTDIEQEDFTGWLGIVSARLTQRTTHADLCLHLFGIIAVAGFAIAEYSDLETEQMNAWLTRHHIDRAARQEIDAVAHLYEHGDVPEDCDTVMALASHFEVPVDTAVVCLAQIVATLRGAI